MTTFYLFIDHFMGAFESLRCLCPVFTILLQCIAGYTLNGSYGYDYYTPERQACYHYYGREGVPLFWENNNLYTGSGTYGMNRLNAIIHMNVSPSTNWIRTDELKYGIGKVRDVQTFFDVFGIHVKEQRVEGKLCSFVGRPMQAEFISSLTV